MLVKSDADDRSGRMQMDGQVSAITHLTYARWDGLTLAVEKPVSQL